MAVPSGHGEIDFVNRRMSRGTREVGHSAFHTQYFHPRDSRGLLRSPPFLSQSLLLT